MSFGPPEWLRRTLSASAAPLLLLVTPFIVFLQYQRYGLLAPEVLACLAVLGGAALALGAVSARSRLFEVAVLATLLTLFIDVQFDRPDEKVGFALTALGLFAGLWVLRRHAARIVTLGMATILVTSLPLRGVHATRPSGAVIGAHGRDLPLVVHVVLDEHTGIAGLPSGITPPSLQRDLESLYLADGFRLFTRAYSEHFDTQLSLAHVVNFEPGEYDRRLVGAGQGGFSYRLKRNAYFEREAQRGYAIRVYQSDFLDFCGDRTNVRECHTYRVKSLDALEGAPLSVPGKVVIVAGMYLDRSYLYGKVKDVYIAARRSRPWMPDWDWERRRVAPLASMAMLNRLIAEMPRAARGDMIFTHLLLPHYPYTYDAECHVRPPSEWLDRTNVGEGRKYRRNTKAMRALRYAAYLQQVRCVEKKIGQLVDAIPQPLQSDAIIVVQSDHGSRITLEDPQTSSPESVRPSDYVDAYSALFAVRAPAIESGLDSRIAPLTCLVRALATSDFGSVAGVDSCMSAPTVFFQPGGHRPVVAKPFPGFGPSPGRDQRTSGPVQGPSVGGG